MPRTFRFVKLPFFDYSCYTVIIPIINKFAHRCIMWRKPFFVVVNRSKIKSNFQSIGYASSITATRNN